jgi:hypothetical protein
VQRLEQHCVSVVHAVVLLFAIQEQLLLTQDPDVHCEAFSHQQLLAGAHEHAKLGSHSPLRHVEFSVHGQFTVSHEHNPLTQIPDVHVVPYSQAQPMALHEHFPLTQLPSLSVEIQQSVSVLHE